MLAMEMAEGRYILSLGLLDSFISTCFYNHSFVTLDSCNFLGYHFCAIAACEIILLPVELHLRLFQQIRRRLDGTVNRSQAMSCLKAHASISTWPGQVLWR